MTPDATAPTILLLHGALGTSAQLEPLAHRLREHVRVLSLDFEGHGLTAPGSRPFRIEYFAENALALLRGRHAEPVHLFGYSLGGYVGLHLAHQAPGRIASVFTLGTKPWWSSETAARETAQLDADAIRAKVPKFAALLESRHGVGGWRGVLDRTAEMMRALGSSPVLDETAFGAIQCPVRVGVGDRDATVSVDESLKLARTLPLGELEVFPGTPHPVERVSWKRLVLSVLEFIGRDGAH
jgi:pimeloyl-ACP methyl ester carboxylesterase